MRSHSHLNTARNIITSYDGSIPFASWLKQFFKGEKKYGSSDRRQIGQLCYCYFRLGRSFKEKSIDEKLLIGIFLCSSTGNLVLKELQEDWNEKVGWPLVDKLRYLSAENEWQQIFSWPEKLSETIGKEFGRSFLVQPDLFLRIRPGKKTRVIAQLEEAGIDYVREGDCLRLPVSSRVDQLLNLDTDVVVQDLNSQKTIGLYGEKHAIHDGPFGFWDCCAASGGKTILFHDLFPAARITVSDIRESILSNLKKRFQRAGILSYESFVADIASKEFKLDRTFEFVLCDAPCSGSGTWSRTPEQLLFFREEKIMHYTDLQKRIVLNASKGLVPGGYFLYITCSVFREENEGIVDFISEKTPLQLVEMKYYTGYDKKADTLFAALFRAGM